MHWRRKKETCVAIMRERFVPGSKIESQRSWKNELIFFGGRGEGFLWWLKWKRKGVWSWQSWLAG